MSRGHGLQALREKKSSGAKSRTPTRITPKPIPKTKTMRTKRTQNHYPLGAWKRTWSGLLNDRGMVGGERLQFSAGGKVRLNRTRAITPPLGARSPSCAVTLTSGWILPPGPSAATQPLLCIPRLGAARATRSQGAKKLRSKRSCHQLTSLALWSQ